MPSTEDTSKQEAELNALRADIEGLKVKLESFGEIRKATTERFAQVNELIGELRGMVMDVSKNVQRLEISATRAVDKVESVQPEMLLMEVRKVDAKVEALKANIESNEAMMNQLFEQIKGMRSTITAFRGMEQVVKVTEEIKGDIATLKKMEANVERHSDKVESIFMEFQKEFSEFNQLTGMYKALDSSMKKLIGNMDTLNMQVREKAMKKDVENLTNRIKKFEEHISNILNLITKKSKDMELQVREELKGLKRGISADFEARGKRMNLLISKLNELVENNEKISELLRLKPDELKPEQRKVEPEQEEAQEAEPEPQSGSNEPDESEEPQQASVLSPKQYFETGTDEPGAGPRGPNK